MTTHTKDPMTTTVSSHHLGMLTDLLQLNRDAVAGFEAAATRASNPRLVALLERARGERAAAATALEPLIRAAGGDPGPELSVSGTLHRTWMKLRETFSTDGDTALILEVERAEDEIKDAYERAMAMTLPPSLKAIVASQAKEVFAVHDTFSDLKHGRTTL